MISFDKIFADYLLSTVEPIPVTTSEGVIVSFKINKATWSKITNSVTHVARAKTTPTPPPVTPMLPEVGDLAALRGKRTQRQKNRAIQEAKVQATEAVRLAAGPKTVNSPPKLWQPRNQLGRAMGVAYAWSKNPLGGPDPVHGVYSTQMEAAMDAEREKFNANPNNPEILQVKMDLDDAYLQAQPIFEKTFGSYLKRAKGDVNLFKMPSTTFGGVKMMTSGVFTDVQKRFTRNVEYDRQDRRLLAHLSPAGAKGLENDPKGLKKVFYRRKQVRDLDHHVQSKNSHQFVFKELCKDAKLLSKHMVPKFTPGSSTSPRQIDSWQLKSFASDQEMEDFFKEHFPHECSQDPISKQFNRSVVPQMSPEQEAKAMMGKALELLKTKVLPQDIPATVPPMTPLELEQAVANKQRSRDTLSKIVIARFNAHALTNPQQVRDYLTHVDTTLPGHLDVANIALSPNEVRDVRARLALEQVPQHDRALKMAARYQDTLYKATHGEASGKMNRFTLPNGVGCTKIEGGLRLDNGPGTRIMEIKRKIDPATNLPTNELDARILLQKRVDVASTDANFNAELTQQFGTAIQAAVAGNQDLSTLALPDGVVRKETPTGFRLIKGSSSLEVTRTPGGAGYTTSLSHMVVEKEIPAYAPAHTITMPDGSVINVPERKNPAFDDGMIGKFSNQMLEHLFEGKDLDSALKTLDGDVDQSGTLFDQLYGKARATIELDYAAQDAVNEHIDPVLEDMLVKSAMEEGLKLALKNAEGNPALIHAIKTDPDRDTKYVLPIIMAQGTGNAYNAGHVGVNWGTEYRGVMMHALMKRAMKNQMALVGSCGFHQFLLGRMGSHIVCYADDGEVYRFSRHGGDPLKGEDKTSFMKLADGTRTAGAHEQKIETQIVVADADGAQPLCVWKQRANSQLGLPAEGLPGGNHNLMIRDADGDPLWAADSLKLESATTLGGTPSNIGPILDYQAGAHLQPGGAPVGENPPGLDLLQTKSVVMAENLDPGMVLADDLGRRIRDADGNEVTRPQELTMQAVLGGKPVTQAVIDDRRREITALLARPDIRVPTEARPTALEIQNATGPERERLQKLNELHDHAVPPTAAQILAATGADRSRLEQALAARSPKTVDPAEVDRLLKKEVNYQVTKAVRWERVIMSRVNAAGDREPVYDNQKPPKILHTYRRREILNPSQRQLRDFHTVPIHCVHSQNGLNHPLAAQIMKLQNDAHQIELVGEGAAVGGPDSDKPYSTEYRPVVSRAYWKPTGIYTEQGFVEDSTNEAAEHDNIFTTQPHIDMALREAISDVPHPLGGNDPEETHLIDTKLSAGSESNRAGYLPAIQRAVAVEFKKNMDQPTTQAGLPPEEQIDVRQMRAEKAPLLKEIMTGLKGHADDERPQDSAAAFNAKLIEKQAGRADEFAPAVDMTALQADIQAKALAKLQAANLADDHSTKPSVPDMRDVQVIPGVIDPAVAAAVDERPDLRAALQDVTNLQAIETTEAAQPSIYGRTLDPEVRPDPAVPGGPGVQRPLLKSAKRPINPQKVTPPAPDTRLSKADRMERKAVPAGVGPDVYADFDTPEKRADALRETQETIQNVADSLRDLIDALTIAGNPDPRIASKVDLNAVYRRTFARNFEDGVRMNILTPRMQALSSLASFGGSAGGTADLMNSAPGVLASDVFAGLGSTFLAVSGLQMMKDGVVTEHNVQKMLEPMQELQTRFSNISADLTARLGDASMSAEYFKDAMKGNAAHIAAAKEQIVDARINKYIHGPMLTVAGLSAMAGVGMGAAAKIKYLIEKSEILAREFADTQSEEAALALLDNLELLQGLDPTGITGVITAGTAGIFAAAMLIKNELDMKKLDGLDKKADVYFGEKDKAVRYRFQYLIGHEKRARKSDRLPGAALAVGSGVSLTLNALGIAGAIPSAGKTLGLTLAGVAMGAGTYFLFMPYHSRLRGMRAFGSAEATQDVTVGDFASDRMIGIKTNQLAAQLGALTHTNMSFDEHDFKEAKGRDGLMQHGIQQRVVTKPVSKMWPDHERTILVKNMKKFPNATADNSMNFMLRYSQPTEGSLRNAEIPLFNQRILDLWSDRNHAERKEAAAALLNKPGEAAAQRALKADLDTEIAVCQRKLQEAVQKQARMEKFNRKIQNFMENLDMEFWRDPETARQWKELRTEFVLAHGVENLIMDKKVYATKIAAAAQHFKDDMPGKDPLTLEVEANIDSYFPKAFDTLFLKTQHEIRLFLEVTRRKIEAEDKAGNIHLPGSSTSSAGSSTTGSGGSSVSGSTSSTERSSVDLGDSGARDLMAGALLAAPTGITAPTGTTVPTGPSFEDEVERMINTNSLVQDRPPTPPEEARFSTTGSSKGPNPFIRRSTVASSEMRRRESKLSDGDSVKTNKSKLSLQGGLSALKSLGSRTAKKTPDADLSRTGSKKEPGMEMNRLDSKKVSRFARTSEEMLPVISESISSTPDSKVGGLPLDPSSGKTIRRTALSNDAYYRPVDTTAGSLGNASDQVRGFAASFAPPVNAVASSSTAPAPLPPQRIPAKNRTEMLAYERELKQTLVSMNVTAVRNQGPRLTGIAHALYQQLTNDFSREGSQKFQALAPQILLNAGFTKLDMPVLEDGHADMGKLRRLVAIMNRSYLPTGELPVSLNVVRSIKNENDDVIPEVVRVGVNEADTATADDPAAVRSLSVMQGADRFEALASMTEPTEVV